MGSIKCAAVFVRNLFRLVLGPTVLSIRGGTLFVHGALDAPSTGRVVFSHGILQCCLVRKVLHILHQSLPKCPPLPHNNSHIQVLHSPCDNLGRAGGLLVHQHGQSCVRIQHRFGLAPVQRFGESAPLGRDNVRSVGDEEGGYVNGRSEETSGVAAEVKNETLQFARVYGRHAPSNITCSTSIHLGPVLQCPNCIPHLPPRIIGETTQIDVPDPITWISNKTKVFDIWNPNHRSFQLDGLWLIRLPVTTHALPKECDGYGRAGISAQMVPHLVHRRGWFDLEVVHREELVPHAHSGIVGISFERRHYANPIFHRLATRPLPLRQLHVLLLLVVAGRLLL
mmetsp:Transcript_12585/g.27157  ORF Transcript_12585/g.27157 Transcript_12585/m.27157 type:complete len:339 (-) Transcript_12585:177-1193(-)